MLRKIVLLVGIVVIAGAIYGWRKGAIKRNPDGTFQVDTGQIADDLKKDASKVEVSPYTKGETMYSLFKYEDALAAFKKGLSEDPKDDAAPMARYRIAECYKKLDEPAKSLKAYKAFVSKHPDHKLIPQAKKQIEMLTALH